MFTELFYEVIPNGTLEQKAKNDNTTLKNDTKILKRL